MAILNLIIQRAARQEAVANRCCIALWHATLATTSPTSPTSPTTDGLPAPSFLFCPTEYCGRIAQPEDGRQWQASSHRSAYLSELGRELLPIIDLCWTGDEIISPTIR
jgi:hypothetical protein